MLLKDKVVIITGSTTGIGEAIAIECVNQGAKVLLHGRNQQRAEALCDKLAGSAKYFLLDLNDHNYADKVGEVIFQRALDEYGKVDVIVNNAGISPRATLLQSDAVLFDKIMNINVKTAFFLIQQLEKYIDQHSDRSASVVNIGSINAYCGETSMPIYAMSKGAMMTMTRNLGESLNEKSIRVNQINVGWTLTKNEISLKKNQGFPDDWQSLVPKVYAPTGKIIQPTEVAKHVVFWASDYSSPATGQVYELEQYSVIGRNLIGHLTWNKEKNIFE